MASASPTAIRATCEFFDGIINRMPAARYLPEEDYPGLKRSQIAQKVGSVTRWQTARYAAQVKKVTGSYPEWMVGGGQGAGGDGEGGEESKAGVDPLRTEFEPPAKRRKQRDISREKRDQKKKIAKLKEKGEYKKAKRKKPKKEKKDKKKPKKEQETSESADGADETGAAVSGVADMDTGGSGDGGGPEIEYSAFEFKSEASLMKRTKNKKVDKKKMLAKAEAAKAKKEALLAQGTLEAKEAVKDMEWEASLLRAKGVKVKDDPKKIRKTIKREQKRKKKAAAAWAERHAEVTRTISEKQARREKNLRERAEQKSARAKSKSGKRLSRHKKR